jgi:putative pyruvate formate lyase activating enzyme
VGDLILDEHGLAREISPDTFVNVMPQYRPEGLASRYPAIARPLAPREFRQAVDVAREEGLRLARG